jgi:hypothetical protein
MAITQLIYHSRYTASSGVSSLQTLRSVLASSQRNNLRDELTGFLLFDKPWFFQILEGSPDQVTGSYDRIQKDPRHGRVTLMSMRTVAQRNFPQWSMGGAMRSMDQQEIFLRHGSVETLDPAKLSADTVLTLAMDLKDHEISRREALRTAS